MSANDKDVDAVTGTETTGHEWDGIKELNTPLPRWWLWIFYATIVFSIGYCIYYPSIPVSGHTGVSGYSSRGEVQKDLDAAAAEQAGQLEKIASTAVGAIKDDADLHRFAVAGGASAFKVHCSQCHGSGAAGSPGYPNLNDDVWLWGGTVEDIHQTITHGIRYAEDDDSRFSEMPAFGRDEILDGDAIKASAHFVRKLAGLEQVPVVLREADAQQLVELALVENVQRADLGAKGVFYRVRAGPLADRTAADELCVALKARDVGCLVVRR